MIIFKSIRKIGLIIFLFLLVVSLARIPGTNSYFTDSATVEGITLTAGEWTPAPTDEIKKGDVVINEVMWMGSKDSGNPADDGSKDQWVELKNVSGRDLHLKDWYLTYKKNSGSEVKLTEIENDKIVKNGEYFLISHYNKSNSAIKVERDEGFGISDSSGLMEYGKFQINLYTDKNKTLLIDTAGSGLIEPLKGNKADFYSMERNDTPENGEDYVNWHTCDDVASSQYWDEFRTELGTPGAANLSGDIDALASLTQNIQNNVSGGETAVQNQLENNANIDNNQNNNNNGGQNDSVSKEAS
jgi:predicted ribosomally synthesized peptide with SipW-like signal peptide